MTPERIRNLADFFYSSNSAADVPLRICCETGRYTGFDLSRDDFIALFEILSQSGDLKKDLAAFVEQCHER